MDVNISIWGYLSLRRTLRKGCMHFSWLKIQVMSLSESLGYTSYSPILQTAPTCQTETLALLLTSIIIPSHPYPAMPSLSVLLHMTALCSPSNSSLSSSHAP